MVLFFGKRLYVVKVNNRAFFMIIFFISISLFSTWVDRVERKINGVKPGVVLEGVEIGGLLRGEVHSIVEEMAIRYQQLPKEPSIDRKTGEIIEEKNGSIINIQKNIDKVFGAQHDECLNLEKTEIYPRYTAKDLAEADKTWGYFETWVSGSSARAKNITIAVSGISNNVIWPQTVFSFNAAVGPRVPELGYLRAPVIIGGENTIDYGGGVCQVSSTLFNAADIAGLKIVERHRHSKPVYYVPAGRDATVAYGYLDLRIENECQWPVIIKAGIGNGKLWVQILGRGN